MVTYQQLRNNLSVSRQAHCWSPALFNCPQRRGVYNSLCITNPRNPNSASRKIGSIVLSTGSNIFAKIGGNAYSPHRQATVLVSGGGHNDTPSVKYSVIRGTMECLPLFHNTRRRSIYGLSLNIHEGI